MFSGEALDFPDFKSLFCELIDPLQLKDAVAIEYLKKSLPSNLRDMLKSTREIKVCW